MVVGGEIGGVGAEKEGGTHFFDDEWEVIGGLNTAAKEVGTIEIEIGQENVSDVFASGVGQQLRDLGGELEPCEGVDPKPTIAQKRPSAFGLEAEGGVDEFRLVEQVFVIRAVETGLRAGITLERAACGGEIGTVVQVEVEEHHLVAFLEGEDSVVAIGSETAQRVGLLDEHLSIFVGIALGVLRPSVQLMEGVSCLKAVL